MPGHHAPVGAARATPGPSNTGISAPLRYYYGIRPAVIIRSHMLQLSHSWSNSAPVHPLPMETARLAQSLE